MLWCPLHFFSPKKNGLGGAVAAGNIEERGALVVLDPDGGCDEAADKKGWKRETFDSVEGFGFGAGMVAVPKRDGVGVI
jgi:hypothetical protein